VSASPPTSRGRETRDRIVQAAATLVVEQGAAATSLDDVRRATQASKSQLYHYFGDKHGLVDAVVEHFCEAVVGGQEQALEGVADWPGLERWADALVAEARARAGRIGCPIGTLTGELADTDEQARAKLSAAMERWDAALRGALGRMRDAGALRADADVDAFATSTLAAVQGGLLLTKATRDAERLRAALDAALAHLRTAAV
jgi:TetR/AcrR family transcriptional regulator, transcriptional repressor for nem operon